MTPPLETVSKISNQAGLTANQPVLTVDNGFKDVRIGKVANRNMKTTILLFCLLGSTQSLPGTTYYLPDLKGSKTSTVSLLLYQIFILQKQISPTLGLPPTKSPDQLTLLTQQQANQLNPATGLPHGAQTLPFTLGPLNRPQQLQPQMLPIIVAQLGAQGLSKLLQISVAKPHHIWKLH
ncbi:hypothetical protein STEG23_009905, partial [Scotinomys teguina]